MSSDFVDEKFTVAVTYRRTALRTEEYHIIDHDCGLSNKNCSGLDDLLGGNCYTLIFVHEANVRRDSFAHGQRIQEVTEDVMDCVVICKMNNVRDVNDLQRIVASKGALAMIMPHVLVGLTSQIPMFIIPTETLDKMPLYWCGGSVAFQRQQPEKNCEISPSTLGPCLIVTRTSCATAISMRALSSHDASCANAEDMSLQTTFFDLSSECKKGSFGERIEGESRASSDDGSAELAENERGSAPVDVVDSVTSTSGNRKRALEYGSMKDENRLRRWLKGYMLPDEVADSLVQLGVRSIDDVNAMVQLCPEVFDGFALLDGKKLWKAVAALSDANK
jgi:hypothetical protein